MRTLPFQRLSLAVIASALLLSAGCGRESFPPLKQSRTFLHLLNANDATNGVDIYLKSFESDVILAPRLGYMTSWPAGGYASMLTNIPVDSADAERQRVSIRAVSRLTNAEVVEPERFRLSPDVRSTIILIDSLGKPKFVKTIDIFQTPPDSSANVRFMNINYGHISASLRSSDGRILIDRLNFLNYSRFFPAKPGRYTFEFVDDITRRVVFSLPNVQIEGGHTYSFYFTQRNSSIPMGGVEVLD